MGVLSDLCKGGGGGGGVSSPTVMLCYAISSCLAAVTGYLILTLHFA